MNTSKGAPMEPKEMLSTFQDKAQAVSATVVRSKTLDSALEYVVEVCTGKEACQLMVSGCEQPLSEKAEDLCQLKDWSRLMAAPGLDRETLDKLTPLCRDRDIKLINKGLREHLGGIDVGLTWADWGLAETGTLVLDSSDENIRLATMISEVHVAFLPLSRMVKDSYALEETLQSSFAAGPNYMAFITGASRTADIERVLTLGVHGPLDLHIVILTEL
jgi:L-lactate dehydrogenase complex protein LldG